MKNTDVAIIGAGPAGLFAGFYAGMRGLNAIIIDRLEQAGGQLTALYPEKNIYDIAGFNEIKAADLVDNLLVQLQRFESTTTFSLGNNIIDVTKQADGTFLIEGSSENIVAKTIIIAAGNGAFAPRPLGVENEDKYTNIHYFVNDLAVFKDRRVAIFGGGDSAVDWSLTLQDIAKEVHIIHRRPAFRAHAHSVDQLQNSQVNIHTPFVASKLIGDQELAQAVEIKEVKGETTRTIDVDDIICNYGFTSDLGAIVNWNLTLDGNKISVDTTQKTSIDGIFAIGDICTYPGKAALIISGLGEAPIAINSALKFIDPEAIIGTLHSSSVIGGK